MRPRGVFATIQGPDCVPTLPLPVPDRTCNRTIISLFRNECFLILCQSLDGMGCITGKKPDSEESLQRLGDLEQEGIPSEEEAKEAKERFMALFDRSLFSVLVHDLDTDFLDANDAALSLLGYTKEEMASLNIASLFDENHVERAQEVLEEILRTGFQKSPSEYSVHNTIWLLTRTLLRTESKRVWGMFGLERVQSNGNRRNGIKPSWVQCVEECESGHVRSTSSPYSSLSWNNLPCLAGIKASGGH